MIKFKRHVDKIGIIGLILSHSCCWGTALRLGFIMPSFSWFFMKPVVFVPLISFSLIASMFGIFMSYLIHKNILPFIISIISSAVIILSSFVIHNQKLFFVGMIGLICATIYNTLDERKFKKINEVTNG